jgi:hypothetical protein
MNRILSDEELLDLLQRIIVEKEIPLEESCYQRLVTTLAEALCLELGCVVDLVNCCDDPEPGATIHIGSVEPESPWCDYGDEIEF